MSACPYCQQPIPPFSNARACPNCARPIIEVPCPRCGRKTLNLTNFARYGKTECFVCHTEIATLPDDSVAEMPPAKPVPPVRPRLTVTARAPKAPGLPAPEEARKALDASLIGLERATQDREMLRAPDLRTLVTRYLDVVQDALALDAEMAAGTLTADALRVPEQLARVAQLCFLPLWPLEGALLPDGVQAWALAVDELVRRWQCVRRRWLADTVGLQLMPAISGVSTVNEAWHEVDGTGPTVSRVLAPGFLLGDEVLRKARVRAQG